MLYLLSKYINRIKIMQILIYKRIYLLFIYIIINNINIQIRICICLVIVLYVNN